MPFSKSSENCRHSERGNMLFIILIAIVLIGLLTAAIQYSSRPESANTETETLSIRSGEVQRYASELERAVLFIMNNGVSESDIRFAHPDADADYGDLSADPTPRDEVFHPDGGGASYRKPPPDINDGSPWEFYGGTHLPGVGSDKADLIAVLPNVSDAFCAHINEIDGQSSPSDTGGSFATASNPGDCLGLGDDGRFNDSVQFYDTPNTVNEATFTQDPQASAARTALQACVVCAADSKNYFYHVLLAR